MKAATEFDLFFTILEEPLGWIVQMLLKGEPSARVCVLMSIFTIWMCTACEAVIVKEIINHLKSCRTSLLMHHVALVAFKL